MGSRSGRLCRIISVATAVAVVSGVLAAPAAADHQCSQSSQSSQSSFLPPKTGTLVASCMNASQVNDPPGSDSPGEGAATIWISITADQIAFQVHTEGLTVPIHGALVYEGDEGETGPERYTLFGRTTDPNPTGCSSNVDPELRDLLQRSKPFHLEIYDDLWRDGAIRGQLVYTYKSGTPPPNICQS